MPQMPLREYRRVLEGVVDLHIHLAPDVIRRSSDDLEFLQVASEAGYGGFLVKNHYINTADRAALISKHFPRLPVYGGISLNHAVGGLNPEAVEIALTLGAKQVWMPTLNAENHIRIMGSPTLPTAERIAELKSRKTTPGGIRILSGEGVIKEEVKEILAMIAEADAILGTGHLSLEEIYALVREAKRLGVKKILVTHPEFKVNKIPAEDQRRLADMGAIMEHCAVAGYDAREITRNIKSVGASRCIISSDSGQPAKGHPLDVMYRFIKDLMAEGISEEEIRVMAIDNPRRLLGIE